MTNKTELLYKSVFENLKLLLHQHNSNFRSPTKVMADFESALRNAVADCFGREVIIEGCYFHFCKAIWYKAAKLGLTSRKNGSLRKTKILILFLKLLIHMGDGDERKGRSCQRL